MSIHVRHNAQNKQQPRIIIGAACVALCGVAIFHTQNISVQISPSKTTSSLSVFVESHADQHEETLRVDIEPCSLPQADPLYLIDTSPALEQTYLETSQLKDLVTTDDEYHCNLSFSAFSLQEIPEEQTPRNRTVKSKANIGPATQKVNYTPPKYAATPHPPYPRELKRMRISGTVRIRVHINVQGSPTSVDILSTPHPAFAKIVKQTVLRSWKFIPAMNGNTPTDATITTSVHFVY